MSSTDRFWASVRDEQDRVRDHYLAGAKAHTWVRTRRDPRRWALVGAVPVVAAAALCAVLWRSHLPRDLAFTVPDGRVGQVGAWIAAAPEGPLPLRFSDGSVVSLFAGTRARVAAVDANGARIVLERGGASASVVHRDKSHWLVDVGPFEVVVVGTRFDVNWDSNEEVFGLDLHEGSVLVSGACLQEPRSVVRGHRLRVSCRAAQEEILETRSDEDGVGGTKPTKSAFEPTSEPQAGEWRVAIK